MANPRAIGQMLNALRAEASVSSKAEKNTKPKDTVSEKSKKENSKKSSPVKNYSCETEAKTKAKTKSNADKRDEKNAADEGKHASDSVAAPSHPKAVGNLLKMLQSDKERYYEEPQKKKSDLKIFTQYHGSRKEPNEYEDEYDFSILEKKEKIKADENEFYCDLCKVCCTSQVVLDTHLIGKRHMKNVKKLEDATLAFKTVVSVPPSKHLVSAEIQPEFDNLADTESLVGLEYVTEYQSFGESAHRYFCELCELRTNMEDMLHHVIGRKHRLRYMRTHFFDIYYKITGYPSFQNIMAPSDADKLLKQHSSFVIRTVLKGNLPQCKVKPFRGEASMQIDLRKHPGPGGIHPSQHKDLPKAESLLAKAEIAEQKEKEEMERKRKEEEKKQKEAEERQKEIEEQQRMEQQRLEKEREIELIVERRRDRLVHEAARMGHQLAGPSHVSQEYALTTKLQESRLNEQEIRIMTALRRLQDSCQDREMNADEYSAKKKLIRLLAGIRAQRQTNTKHVVEGTRVKQDTKKQSLQITRENEKEMSYNVRPTLENQFKQLADKHSDYTNELNTDHMKNHSTFRHRSNAAESKATPGLVEMGSDMTYQTGSYQAVDHLSNRPEKIDAASVIEKTRQQVEAKILQALTSGSLAPLAEAFKNNPKLQAGLKHWEKQHRETYSEATTSQTVQDLHVKNFNSSSMTQHNIEYSSTVSYNENASQTIEMPYHHTSHSLDQVYNGVGEWQYEKEHNRVNPVEDCEKGTTPVVSGFSDQQKTIMHSCSRMTTEKEPDYNYLDDHDMYSDGRSHSRSENFDESPGSQASRSGYSENSLRRSSGQVRERKRDDTFVRKSKNIYSRDDNKYTYRNDSDNSETGFEDEDFAHHKYYRRDYGEDSSRRTGSKYYNEKSKTSIGSRPQITRHPARRKYPRENSSTSRSDSYYY